MKKIDEYLYFQSKGYSHKAILRILKCKESEIEGLTKDKIKISNKEREKKIKLAVFTISFWVVTALLLTAWILNAKG